MYTSPNAIIDTIIGLLERNSPIINNVIQRYVPQKNLTVFKGRRAVIPVDNMPSLEIVPTSASNSWAATRVQRPRFTFDMSVSFACDNETIVSEYTTEVTQTLVRVLTDPQNLQMPIMNEVTWTQEGGYIPSFIMDSFINDVIYASEKAGTIYKCQFSWWCNVNEPYPDIKFRIGDSNVPTVMRPRVV